MLGEPIVVPDIPPTRLLLQKDVLLWLDDSYSAIVVHNSHHYTCAIGSAVVFHEQRRSAASARATNRHIRRLELDAGLDFREGTSPVQGGVMEQAKTEEGCSGKLPTGNTVAESYGNGERAAGVGDQTTGTATAQYR